MVSTEGLQIQLNGNDLIKNHRTGNDLHMKSVYRRCIDSYMFEKVSKIRIVPLMTPFKNYFIIRCFPLKQGEGYM